MTTTQPQLNQQLTSKPKQNKNKHTQKEEGGGYLMTGWSAENGGLYSVTLWTFTVIEEKKKKTNKKNKQTKQNKHSSYQNVGRNRLPAHTTRTRIYIYIYIYMLIPFPSLEYPIAGCHRPIALILQDEISIIWK